MNIKVHYTGSTGNLFQIDNLLIDPGVSIKRIKEALDYKLSDIAGCLVSHAHKDHCKGVNDIMKCGTSCYMSFETAQEINASGHRVNIIAPDKQFEIGNWKIKPFKLIHDVFNLGFLISKDDEKILFATDTAYIPYRFKGLTGIMISIDFDLGQLKENVDLGHLDSGLAKRIIKNHMSLQNAVEFFKANDMSQVKEIYILHLSKLNSEPDHFREEIQKVTGRPTYLKGDI
jgi:phosphoribosyl 1,2-cyclic phosphodiesterase